MTLPVNDWQFWVVTLVALLAAAYVLREVIPWPWKKPRGKPTTLTIRGKSVETKTNSKDRAS